MIAFSNWKTKTQFGSWPTQKLNHSQNQKESSLGFKKTPFEKKHSRPQKLHKPHVVWTVSKRSFEASTFYPIMRIISPHFKGDRCFDGTSWNTKFSDPGLFWVEGLFCNKKNTPMEVPITTSYSWVYEAPCSIYKYIWVYHDPKGVSSTIYFLEMVQAVLTSHKMPNHKSPDIHWWFLNTRLLQYIQHKILIAGGFSLTTILNLFTSTEDCFEMLQNQLGPSKWMGE